MVIESIGEGKEISLNKAPGVYIFKLTNKQSSWYLKVVNQ